jgi:hypothetical protein
MKRFRDTHYWITEDGRVWNERLKRDMKPHNNKRYLRIELSINKKPKKFFVHRLVAECYLANPEEKPTVNHIDGNPSNNHVTNLEWATVAENTQHAYDNGLAKVVNRKFGKEEILNIYYLHKRGHSMRSIGRLYNSCHKDISHILRGKTYKEFYAYY